MRMAVVFFGVTLGMAACSRPNFVRKPSSPLPAGKIVYFGLDFSATGFADRDFDAEEVIKQDIPSWNRETAKFADSELHEDFQYVGHLQQSMERNTQIDHKAFLYVYDRSHDTADARALETVAKTYSGGDGYGFVIAVQRMTKEDRVVAYGILFDNAGGDVLAIVEAKSKLPKRGSVYSIYGEALREVVTQASQEIRRLR